MKKLPSIKVICKALIVICFMQLISMRVQQITVISLDSTLSTIGNTVAESMFLHQQRASLKAKEENILITDDMKQEIDIVSLQASSPVIVYDGMTMEDLAAKLDRSLSSDLTGYGMSYAKYSIQYGVDPYMAVAISLLETGCNWSCSSLTTYNHNVGGMQSSDGYAYFNTMDEGIEAMISNLYANYISKGLVTPEQIGTRYASSSTWAQKVNNYISTIKNA